MLKKNTCRLHIIIVLTLILSNVIYGQAPQLVNYQAVVRNSSGQPLAQGTIVNLRFSIHNLSASGQVVFTETQSTTTNQFGLVNLEIGSVGSLAIINWGNGAKYLQVEVDINNTGTFADMGVTQLLSVPYALFAAQRFSFFVVSCFIILNFMKCSK